MEALIIYPTKAQEKTVTEFLKALNVQFEKKRGVLPPHVLAGIKKGQEDIKAGDTFTYDEFKQQLVNGHIYETLYHDDLKNIHPTGDTIRLIYSSQFPKIYTLEYEWNK
jgi:hypothetical protein